MLVSFGESALVSDRSVRFEPVGLQCIQDDLVCLWLLSRRVDVFDPDKPFAAIDLGLRIASDCS